MLNVLRVLGLGPALMFAACAGVPRMNELTDSPTAESDVRQVIQRIACEAIDARQNVPGFEHYWIAYSLSMKAQDSGGLSPSVSVIHPLPAAMTSETTSLGGSIVRSATRTFTHSGVFAVDTLRGPDCTQEGRRDGITGNLGLREVIATGVGARNELRALEPATPPPAPPAVSTPGVVPEGAAAPVKETAPSFQAAPGAPTFATTIEFSMTGTLSAGRAINRVRFRGPSPATGLFNFGRVDTHTLNLGFAVKAPAAATQARDEEVVRALILR